MFYGYGAKRQSFLDGVIISWFAKRSAMKNGPQTDHHKDDKDSRKMSAEAFGMTVLSPHVILCGYSAKLPSIKKSSVVS